jgi:hypothetical protein
MKITKIHGRLILRLKPLDPDHSAWEEKKLPYFTLDSAANNKTPFGRLRYQVIENTIQKIVLI